MILSAECVSLTSRPFSLRSPLHGYVPKRKVYPETMCRLRKSAPSDILSLAGLQGLDSPGQAFKMVRMVRSITAFFVFIIAFHSPGLAPAREHSNALQHAKNLEKAGQFRESILAYQEVLRSDPANVDADVGLGRSFYALREYPEAAASFERGLQKRPQDPAIINWTGRSYLQEKQPERVLELVSHQKMRDSQSAVIHLLLARAYDAQDKIEAAVSEIQRALALDRHCHGAHFARGFIAWTTGDLPTAEAEFRQELALDPHSQLAAYYLSEVLLKVGNVPEAEAALAQMGRDAPDSYLDHLGFGKVYEREKKYEAAAEQFREAIRLEPDLPEAHYHLGGVLHALGDNAGASREFQSFTRLQNRSMAGAAQGMGRMRPHIPNFE